jgi:4,5-DOPA dioxygenase extradiol
MPVIFAGHGSPMNAIEDNRFSREWKRIAAGIPAPKAILCVSAHWVTDGTCVNDQPQPKTVYDMYGFPKELYELVYQPPGSPELAAQAIRLLGQQTAVDNSWGIDHGTWSVLVHMFPDADIPVVQLSIDANSDMEDHYRTGQKLQALREQGVLVLGSGNVVHNLGLINWNQVGGEPWAVEFDNYVKENILARRFEKVIHYGAAGNSSLRAFPTTEHYVPLLAILGCSTPDDEIYVFNDQCVLGSLSMTGYLFG